MRWESNSLGRIIDHAFSSPLAYAFAAATSLAALWGLVDAYEDLTEWMGTRLGAAVLTSLMLLVILPALLGLFVQNKQRALSLPFGQRFLYINHDRKWTIDATGDVSVVTKRTYLFFKEPHPADLSDTAYGDYTDDLESIGFNSPDAESVAIERRDEKTHRVLWQPKMGRVEVGRPYEHTVVTRYPYKLPLKAARITIPVHAHTLCLSLTMHSELPIQSARAFRAPRDRHIVSKEKVEQLAGSIASTRCPPPRRIDDNQFVWTLTNAPPDALYYITLNLTPPTSSEEVPARE
ncbi:MAG TPA: hypothetical protein VF006_16145 [Longimicrobium sp.]